jgi:serine/threonine-protein kinase
VTTTPDLAGDAPLVGRVLDGRYRLETPIARGGMATVYEAVDERLDRRVAVKVMHRAFADDPAFVARFTREARSAARLSAPEVVSVFDQGHDADHGVVYLVMELVSGRDLRALLRERGSLAPAKALAVLDPVLTALAAAHAAGLVHRDVKPENVLLGDDGRIKVADFGLARAVEASSVTASTGLILGTVAYLAPEQIERGVSDPRTDVYAAGVMLWELLTGVPPHDGDTPMNVLFRHVNHDVPAPSTLVGGIPPAVDDLVLRATRRDPALRPADAGAFLAEVRALRGALPAADGATHDTVLLPGAVPDAVPGQQPRPRTPTVPDTPRGPVVPPRVPPKAAKPAKPAKPPRSHRARRWRWVAAAVVLVLLAGGGTWAWWWEVGRYTDAPGVVSQTEVDATERLNAAGLHARVAVDRVFDDTVPVGSVVSQSPGPDGKVLKDGTVTLTLSKGVRMITVPGGLVGLSAADATAALKAVELGATTDEAFSTRAVGTVVSTLPEAGGSSRHDVPVKLTISKGVEQVAVDSVVGRAVDDATARLKAKGFAVTTNPAYDEKAPKDQVLSQTPAGGNADKGSTVTLVVSQGPEPRTLDNWVGAAESTARKALEAQGLKVKVQSLPGGPNKVLNMSPGAGQKVDRGGTVTLYVF